MCRNTGSCRRPHLATFISFGSKQIRASAKERDMEDGEELVKVWSGLEMQWEGTGQSQVTKWVENLGNLRASVFVNTIRLDYL